VPTLPLRGLRVRRHLKTALELRDARVDHFAAVDGDAVIRFPFAYIRKSSGTPGRDPGTGWSQEVQPTLAGVSYLGALPPLPNTILEGHLEVGGIRHAFLPLPFRRRGRAAPALEFIDGTRFDVSGEHTFIERIGLATSLEDYL
jgi:hypothetical protein